MFRMLLYVIAYLIMVIVNYLANAIPLNGQTTGEISRKVNVLFTPASYTFAIWGLIYFLLALWILRMFPSSRRSLPMYTKAFLPFIFTCLWNSLWIFSWHYERFILSVVLMILLLLSLIFLYLAVKETQTTFFDLLPISLYLGWISVATINNISFTLKDYQWSGWGISEVTWTIIMLIIATVLALYFSKYHHDFIYPLVFVWAFVGISVKNRGDEALVSYVALILAVIIILGTSYIFDKKERT